MFLKLNGCPHTFQKKFFEGKIFIKIIFLEVFFIDFVDLESTIRILFDKNQIFYAI